MKSTKSWTELTLIERNDLQYNEGIVAKGIETFREVGEALGRIRDGRLYRATHRTFDDYCRERWNFSKTYANNVIKSAEAVASLPGDLATMVVNERTARAVAALPTETRIEVVTQAVTKVKSAGRSLQTKDIKPQVNRRPPTAFDFDDHWQHCARVLEMMGRRVPEKHRESWWHYVATLAGKKISEIDGGRWAARCAEVPSDQRGSA